MPFASGCKTGPSSDSGRDADLGPGPSHEQVRSLLDRPLLELVFEAAKVHRRHHDPRRLQCAQLLSIKTGECPEDCGYCSQSVHHDSGLARQALMANDEDLAAARRAREGGADRFCMGAAWRQVQDGPEFERVLGMVRQVKELGLETCATLGMLTDDQARRLSEAGLDYYNHNLDTGRSHYEKVVSTRCYDDRLRTIDAVRRAGMKVCCGGIIGLGEDREVRAELLAELAGLDPAPESVPINSLVAVEGTPMAGQDPVDWSELVRTVAAARVLLPTTALRLSAGRLEMHEAVQAMCFLAGANSIFLGDQLLTVPNRRTDQDADLLAKLGLMPLCKTNAEVDGAP